MPEKSADLEKKLPPLKHILALPIWGQICTNLEVEPFEITNFDLGHPVSQMNIYIFRQYNKKSGK